MSYAVKDIFGPTIQGEGSLTGLPSLFVRLAGCNMWDGRPETRAASACPFCDTDFLGGERLMAGDIVRRLAALDDTPGRWVTITGGEPLLQVDQHLTERLGGAGYRLAVETNGTRALPTGARFDLAVMSPKVARAEIELEQCDDLKVLYPHPQRHITPEAFADFPAARRWVQPVNDDDRIAPVAARMAFDKALELSRSGVEWGVSLQMHKALGVP